MERIYSLNMTRTNLLFARGIILLLLPMMSCLDFIEIDRPKTQLTKTAVFADDATATAAISGIYAEMNVNFAGGAVNSTMFLNSLLSDEAIWRSGAGANALPWFENNIVATNPAVTALWGQLYSMVYKTNSIIEGISASTSLSQKTSEQLKGEALFLRAFAHFYLVNYFGDVPYIKSTDHSINRTVSRQVVADVYDEIIRDLTEAIELLSSDYSFSKNERVRANRWVAKALLARVFLYSGKWALAKEHATELINQPSFQLLPNHNGVFLKNSKEAILQLFPLPGATFTSEGNLLLRTPFFSTLQNELVNSFPPEDTRRTSWMGSVVNAGLTYYYPTKYKEFSTNGTGAEYSTVFRLAEQYLIRAEANFHLNELSAGLDDLEAIRQRSGLAPLSETNPSMDRDALLLEVERQRRHEFFSEWGHRWFDLKRTGRADELMSLIKPGWDAHDSMLPIPENELLVNPALAPQNPGY
jgi:hypothetical protein